MLGHIGRAALPQSPCGTLWLQAPGRPRKSCHSLAWRPQPTPVGCRQVFRRINKGVAHSATRHCARGLFTRGRLVGAGRHTFEHAASMQPCQMPHLGPRASTRSKVPSGGTSLCLQQAVSAPGIPRGGAAVCLHLFGPHHCAAGGLRWFTPEGPPRRCAAAAAAPSARPPLGPRAATPKRRASCRRPRP